MVGTFGQIATVSFYPAHHITMGEGGALLTDQPKLKTLIESFRDWGRDCWCEPGQDGTCAKRFDWQLGDLPHGYDHKYTYSHIGYNLKATDMQAAVGLAQIQKLDGFIATRRANFAYLNAGMQDLQEFFILPEATPHSQPSWFGFPLAVRPGAPFNRSLVIQILESHKIATRLLFGGNLTRQPAYKNIPQRSVGALGNSDFVMNNVFWVGLYPGLSAEMLAYLLEIFHQIVSSALSTSKGI
jgi:CDP-6-deoxy-D-xylo-4-hexulose-3-dehydrase